MDCEDPSCEDAKPLKATRQQIWWVTYLGLCFCLCFTAYNVAQSFLTTLYPRYGFAAFFTVYMAFGIGSLFAPSATALIGVKWSIVCGMSVYVLFILSINLQIPGLLLLMGALNGLGAGLMWITQGTWITLVSEHGGEIGFFTGLFFTITNVSGVIGNVAAMFILQVGLSTAFLIWIMVIVAAVAVLGTVFQQQVPHAPQKHVHPQTQLSTRQRLMQVAEQLKHRRMQLMLPYMVTQGIGVGVTFAVFPKLMPEEYIPRAFLAYGITSCVGSFALGKLYDRMGWQSVVATHVVCVVGGYVLAIVVAMAGWDYNWQLVSGLFLGVVDVASNSITNMTVSEFWGNEAPQGSASTGASSRSAPHSRA
jgi:MFS family permease